MFIATNLAAVRGFGDFAGCELTWLRGTSSRDEKPGGVCVV